MKKVNTFIERYIFPEQLLEEAKTSNKDKHMVGLLISSVNAMASALLNLSEDEPEKALSEGVAMMAHGIGVDRVYVFKNLMKNGRLCYREVFSWLDDGAAERIPLPVEDQDLAFDDIFFWPVDEFVRAPFIYVPVMTDSEIWANKQDVREYLLACGIYAMLLVPIIFRGEFWGYITYDNCRAEREILEDEQQLLHSGSLLLANAIIRNEMMQNLVRAQEEAKAASKAKSDFLSSMSHEMRTPLNAVIGMTAIGKAAADIERKDYAFGKITDASTHLLGVINDILDMSKIEADKFELSPEEFSFEKMLQKVTDIVNFRMEEKNLNFFVNIGENIPDALIGDDQRLAQVITNLLSNAVKFTPESRNVTLSASLVGEADGVCELRVEVADEGIGISEEQQSRLFTAFEQAESSTSRKFGGTGLGLAISKRIVEMMDGRIWVTSEVGRGSAFIFTVKLKLGEGKRKRLFGSGLNIKDLRILAVDDAPEVLEYFARITSGFGVESRTALSGREALELIERDGAFDLYFIDWRMPGMDGIELARTIREREGKKPEIVMMSATEWSVIEREAREASVGKFLPKPLFPSAVADCISERLGVAEQSDDGPKRHESDDFSGRRILLAEDVEINREIVQALLEPTGVDIDFAVNGAAAVQMFREAPERYDVIFMDVQMPEMDGYEATRTIRALDFARAREIPIVAMTANVFREDIDRCIASGMNSHIGKPLNLDDILQKLRVHLSAG